MRHCARCDKDIEHVRGVKLGTISYFASRRKPTKKLLGESDEFGWRKS